MYKNDLLIFYIILIIVFCTNNLVCFKISYNIGKQAKLVELEEQLKYWKMDAIQCNDKYDIVMEDYRKLLIITRKIK